MKLQDVKDRIDNYFDNITAEELYDLSVLKYGFSEITFKTESSNFKTSEISYYSAHESETVFTNFKTTEDCNLPLAS